MIRYHSLYLWHDKNEYGHLENETDKKMKEWVKKFNKYDLYTKDENIQLNLEELRSYYDTIVKKYIKKDLFW